MSKVEFKLDKSGVGELLKSDDLSGYLKEIASQKINNASGQYDIKIKSAQTRKYITVSPSNKQTYFRNLRTNELIKVVGV